MSEMRIKGKVQGLGMGGGRTVSKGGRNVEVREEA